MKIINNHKVCNGCKFSSLHYCSKFNEICLSTRLNAIRYQLICKSCELNDSYTFGLNEEIKKDQKLKANFRIPGLQNLPEIESLLMFRKYYPEAFLDNRRIVSIYDAFPGAIWNGRQPNFDGIVYSKEELIDIRQRIENLNLSFNLTWNNSELIEDDIHDRFCNIITEIFHTGKHSITVASPILYQYLKNKYPNYTYYNSVILTDNYNISNYNFNQNYDKYVITRKVNNNWEELLKIPEEDRVKIEFLCNDFCPPFCNREYHYTLGNQMLLERSNPINPVKNYCSLDYDFLNFNNNYWPTTIHSEDIDLYLSHNFSNFKLCSRGDSTPILLLKILPYFVKPEYILDAFSWSLNHYTTIELIAAKKKGD